jgi:signal transduction histidine kinase/CheY-like chemotaxis protein
MTPTCVCKRPELAASLLADDCRRIWVRTDRMFAWLLLAQWLACVGIALIVSPRAWDGMHSHLHPHVWVATLGGALVIVGPILGVFLWPGTTATRQQIAVAQALVSSLLIHLTGGRIESHFHIFGSLAFLSFYRDWRVLITASAVITLDHLLRGTLWPESVFGFASAGSWRWLEHAGWVLFEDVFLIYSCQQSLAEMREITCREANDVDAAQRQDQIIFERTAALQQREEDLRSSRDRAEAASIAKGEFLANMSHEIRTPMTAILGYTELLCETGDIRLAPQERLDAIRTIQHNSKHLLDIINDILDISKIEAGKMTVDLQECDLVELMEEVECLMRHRAQSKRLDLSIVYYGLVPERIQTDSTRLRQMLLNLIGNAIKFTEHGSVRVEVRFLHEPVPRLQIDVIDTGIGIPLDRQATLFQPFVQADSSMTRRFGGTGLGLVISERLARMLEGDLAIVASQPGYGTRFRLTLPSVDIASVRWTAPSKQRKRQNTQLEELRVVAHQAIAGARVLLAEDGPDNQRLVRHLLETAGAHVELAENGQIASRKALAALDAGAVYDVILMDMQMPEMNGYEATALLRAHGYAKSIVALTAHAMSGDRQKCIDAGCDDFLTKPISREALHDAVAKCMPQHSQPIAS